MGKIKGGRSSLKPKLGKNKKRTWKQIQHDDVDQFLDDMREDERLGGIRSKTDHQLFSIDKIGFIEEPFSAPNGKDIFSTNNSESEDNEEEGPLVKIDNLKCFRLLKPHTAVPDPVIKRNRIRKPGEKKSVKMIMKDNLRLCKKKILEPKEKEVCMDPWATVEPKGVLDSEWVDSHIKRHNIKQRATRNKKHLTSMIPAVEPPHPGYSYNPTFKDHQDLIRTATEIESEKVKKEQKLIRATAPTKCDSVDTDDLLSSGQVKEEEKSEDEEDADVKPLLTPRIETKTKKKRRKETEEIDKKRLANLRKLENVRQNDVYRIKSIQKEIVSTEKKQKNRLVKLKEKKQKHENFGQKKLSKFKYEEPSLNPALSNDLTGSLVGVPSNNSVLLDRFKSLQKRNILEPRVRTKVQKKNRVKKFIRTSDKMDWEKTGFYDGMKV